MRHRLLAGVLCLALPAGAGADLINTASVSFRDSAGALHTNASNTVTTTVSIVQTGTAPPAPDVSGIDGGTFGPNDTIRLPYSGNASGFNWEFDPNSSQAGSPRPFGSGSASGATLSTASPQLRLNTLSLTSGAYLLRVQAVGNGQTSGWATARITWVAAVGINVVRVYPNPVRTAHGDAALTFDQLPPNATIKIFTVSARLIKTIEAQTATVTWDLANDAGEKVASGLYLYLITDGQGEKAKGKFTVIR